MKTIAIYNIKGGVGKTASAPASRAAQAYGALWRELMQLII